MGLQSRYIWRSRQGVAVGGETTSAPKNVISSNHLFLITQRTSASAASLHHSLLCLYLSPSRCALLLRRGGGWGGSRGGGGGCRDRGLFELNAFFLSFFLSLFFLTIKLEIIHLIPMQQSAHSLSHTHTQERLCNTCHVTHTYGEHICSTPTPTDMAGIGFLI